jgi:hypothetical protein
MKTIFALLIWLKPKMGTFLFPIGLEINYTEFAIIKNQAGLNNFRISVKELIEKTNIICLQAKAGRYGGTYAHKDIAFEFALWISPEFKIYVVKEFQRLKEEEQKTLGWTAKRELAKIHYLCQRGGCS